MKELLSTNDVVLLSFAQDLLSQSGVDYVVFDTNMSIVEGSIGILPRRIMVSDDDFDAADNLINNGLSEAALSGADGNEIDDDDLTASDGHEFELDEELLTDDLFLGGALKIFQPKKGFRSGIDAILLAASLPDLPQKDMTRCNGAQAELIASDGTVRDVRVLEAGCGAGVVSLAIAERCPNVTVDAIEIEHFNAAIARRNAARNGLDDRVTIMTADLTEPVTRLELLGLQRNSYDYVVANPPFFQEKEMRFSDNPLRQRAKRAKAETLEQWVRFLTAMAAPKGVISLIYRADALADVLAVLDGRFGGVRVLPLFSKPNVPANRVIVQGVKGSRAPLTLLQGVVLHDEGGCYLPEVKALCEGPCSLPGL